jgi:uncharacterized membrane protein
LLAIAVCRPVRYLQPEGCFINLLKNEALMTRLALLTITLLAFAASTDAQLNFTSLDYPGGTLTTARGINNRGDIVGSYSTVPAPPPYHVLLIKRGQFIPLAPATLLGADQSEAFKSNDRGDVVGEFVGDDGFFHGFFLSHGTVTTLDFPGASDTYAFGITNSRTVVGYWDLVDASGNVTASHGYMWRDGTFTEWNFPGSVDSALFGINARGDLVGGWDAGVTSPQHGFVCSKGRCFSFDVPVPGATLTQVNDINARGQMVGVYFDSAGAFHAFLATGANFTSFDFPGARSTSAWGINARGQIVGRYIADGAIHGYLAELLIAEHVGGDPQTLSPNRLPVVSLPPASLTFATEEIGTTSAAQVR